MQILLLFAKQGQKFQRPLLYQWKRVLTSGWYFILLLDIFYCTSLEPIMLPCVSEYTIPGGERTFDLDQEDKMAHDIHQETPLHLQCFLPPPGRRSVRSFLFSRRIDAPLPKVHLLARVLLVLCLSGALLRSINTAQLDPIGALLLWGGAFLILLLGGATLRTLRMYFLLTLPTLVSLFLTWIVLNPVPGSRTFLRVPVYTGIVSIGLAPWQGVLLLIAGGYFLITRKLFLGVLGGIVAAVALISWVPLPEWRLIQVPFFHALTLSVSDQGVLIAVTKVIGYSGMILASLALVTTTREVELLGVLRQLHLPAAVSFFLSTLFRSLDLALSDYDTIRQAQLARAIRARPRSFIRRLRDLANMAIPMVAMMIRRASEIGEATLARGYRLGQTSTNFYETTPLRPVDALVLVISLCLLYLAVGPHPSATTLLLHQLAAGSRIVVA
jgi:energy-coupling factor transporter transmembrane protein EcfT